MFWEIYKSRNRCLAYIKQGWLFLLLSPIVGYQRLLAGAAFFFFRFSSSSVAPWVIGIYHCSLNPTLGMKNIYENLSAVKPLAKSYTFKFLFIAFLGIHIPLIGLISFVAFKPNHLNKFAVIGNALLFTLLATGITLYILNGLLLPLRKSRKALHDYRMKHLLPELPTHFPDEAGMLMKNIQFTLAELNDLLEEKKDMTSLLSHDLRTPIRNIKTLSQLLIADPGDAQAVKELAGMIIESTAEQTKLVESVLDILRQDHSFFDTAQYSKVSAAKLLDDTLASFDALARQKSIALKKQVDYNGEITVHPELFAQVLKNLASNAIKFSNKGTEVNFKVYQREGRIVIDVQDSGMGFESQKAESLFERFTKNGRKGTAGETSTGLGLYLSRKIIRQHDGELVAHSPGEGMGAVFSISLN